MMDKAEAFTLKIGWNFPRLDGGQANGVDGGNAVSAFKGTALISLVKEVIQNSLDVRVDATAPVTVQFSVFNIKNEYLKLNYDFDVIRTGIESSENRNNYEQSGNQKQRAFFEQAKKTLSASNICVMRISDFNTSGLTKPDAKLENDEQARNSRWLNLVHGMGSTDKGGASGGSHGQGKSAALSNSSIRTIFYATVDTDNKEAFQGAASIGCHHDNNNDFVQSVGYYGNKDDNSPIMKCISLDPSYERDGRTGTDIFVMGFEYEKKWINTALVSVLNNYLVALYNNQLIVKLGDSIVVSKDTIESLMERYKSACAEMEDKQDCYADKCFAALKQPDWHAKSVIDLDGIEGNVEIFLKTGIGYPKKVAMVRQIGMKVCNRWNKSSAMQYAGIMYISGEEINAFLASLENVEHTEWSATWAPTDSIAIAARRLKKLYAVLSKEIGNLVNKNTTGKMDVDGLEDYFPIESNDTDESGDHSYGEMNNISSVTIRTYKTSSSDEYFNGSGIDDISADQDGQTEESTDAAYPPRPNSREQTDNTSEDANQNPTKNNVDHKAGVANGPDKHKTDETPTIVKKALFSTENNGEYILKLRCDKNTDIRILLYLCGEDGGDSTPNIKEASLNEATNLLKISKNAIGPVTLQAKKAVKISFVLSDDIKCALGVKIIAD